MSNNNRESNNVSATKSEDLNVPQKRVKMDETSFLSWSLIDRRTDQEELQEMGLSLLEQDDSENSNETETTPNIVQIKPGSKRKHNLENVNPNLPGALTVKSPRKSPKRGGDNAISPITVNKASPRSVEKSPSKPLQPSDLNRQEPETSVTVHQSILDEDTPIPQHPVSDAYLRSFHEYLGSTSPKNALEDPGPSTSSAAQATALTPRKKPILPDAFDKLSDEVLLGIFKWLPKGTLVLCMLVCKRWHRIASDETFWQRLELGNRSIAKNAIGRILARKPVVIRLAGTTIADWTDRTNFSGVARLQYLDLSMCSVNIQTLNALMERCVNLKKLSLENVTIDEETCRHIGNCTRMETLNLAMATGFTPEGLTLMLQGCSGLQSLNISWTKLCTFCIHVLVTTTTQRLQRLNLAGARNLSDEMVATLVERCPRLQELDLSDCPRLTSAAIASLTKLNRLEHLALSRCYQLQAHHLLILGRMPALQFLDVWGMMLEASIANLKTKMPAIQINQFMLSAVARPTVGPRRTSVWGLTTRD